MVLTANNKEQYHIGQRVMAKRIHSKITEWHEGLITAMMIKKRPYNHCTLMYIIKYIDGTSQQTIKSYKNITPLPKSLCF